MLQKFPHTLHLIKSTKWNKSKLCNMLSKGGSISNDYCCFLFIVQQCPSNKVANGVQFMQLIIICKPHNCQHHNHSIKIICGKYLACGWKKEQSSNLTTRMKKMHNSKNKCNWLCITLELVHTIWLWIFDPVYPDHHHQGLLQRRLHFSLNQPIIMRFPQKTKCDL